MMIEQDFFARPTLEIARVLLGQRLVREIEGQRLSGLIVETEAYIGPNDSASHASKGRTPRTEVMFGPPAHTYVYLIYGMYHMLNLVTEPADYPAAVLIRALEPLEGLEMMRTYRRLGKPHRRRDKQSAKSTLHLTNGPGKLCQALGIDKALNNWNITLGQKLWVEPGDPIPTPSIASGPRVGIDYAHPQDQAAPWRFWVRGSRFVSGD